MPASATRAVLRQSQFLTRRTAVRYASNTSEAASKASQTASSAASKASEGLSRVTSTAGPAISNAAQGLGSALRKVGGRTGKVIAFVDSLIPPTLYYSKVGLELAKLVFRGQNMTPPNLATFQSYFQPLINAASNPSALKSFSPQNIISRVRNANKKEIAFAGVTAAEVIGFFTVGEMIGRMNIVGYRGPAHGDHH
ncbi:F1F0 ATP synthase subunit g [Aspergillus clavatus NRRL 1]|uniref:Mitochondrial F1F0-ATP synthase g subunit, putative n=1 Tax=Aspergillus clavatus (strain ATCC 1007 / CBS 513.65 / DSM 816 / NCTC 3887 / NRRL 1 / QM 1276 / 107) TaxID=344612 RepID=A1CNK2_ASPCL|nr:mitochondrial F1F0-ATP synthase g subunit, putative [Aspergillus clavatus NRRL 1]EAW07223.1 mitochondrial F1F0-ATP synthase g subunit, putative [Aspergillus clavatus NRRL 1]